MAAPRISTLKIPWTSDPIVITPWSASRYSNPIAASRPIPATVSTSNGSSTLR